MFWRFFTLLCAFFMPVSNLSLFPLLQATTVRQEWPGWCHFLIAFLILMAAIWIPLVAILKMCGIHLLTEEEPSWFPADELRDFHGVMPHKVSAIEKCLFCIKEEEHDEMWEHTRKNKQEILLHLRNLALVVHGNLRKLNVWFGNSTNQNQACVGLSSVLGVRETKFLNYANISVEKATGWDF